MITIPQHSSSGALNDLKRFIIDLESIQRKVDFWTVHIDECTGPASVALAELTSSCPQLSPSAFADLCKTVDQTIDGEFVAYLSDHEIVRLRAIDSSFWEISGTREFESHMLSKYGAYED